MISFNYSKKLDWETIRAELDKCDLLCANCHALETCTWPEEWYV